ncbi:MAG: hypothetical protein IPH33_15455 [Bacteroidetes bacterium]|nr:hypothetical protein [Bacteroidota bacterium]
MLNTPTDGFGKTVMNLSGIVVLIPVEEHNVLIIGEIILSEVAKELTLIPEVIVGLIVFEINDIGLLVELPEFSKHPVIPLLSVLIKYVLSLPLPLVVSDIPIIINPPSFVGSIPYP